MEAKNNFKRSGGDTCSRFVKIEAIQNKIAAPNNPDFNDDERGYDAGHEDQL